MAESQNHGDSASLAGLVRTPEDDAQRRQTLEQAFDYRGDVTLELEGGQQVTGYLFDRREDERGPVGRLMLHDGTRQAVPWNQVRKVSFASRDPAAGKSWETWVRKYAEKKIRGEQANIEDD